MSGLMTVELRSLRFFGEHGMYAEEKKVGNEFEVDVLISFEAPENPITLIDDTVNYMEVYRIVEAEMQDRKQLLETCAMRICDDLLPVFPRIKKAFVSIKKMAPPITNFTGSVGVSYTREY
jgi:7,8-dihydroneopterin aldolase/epimerase/oxygenase